MQPIFLTLDEVLDIHNDEIALYGGEPSVRDMGLLQSAIAMPFAMFAGQYLHEFPHGMAAAYLFHLVSNHPFVDGNKRTGLAAALVFLDMHELTLIADHSSVEQLVIDVATGRIDKSVVTMFFKDHVRKQ